MTDVRDLLDWTRGIREAHESILINVGSATTRVVTVEALLEQLPTLSPRQQAFMRESISSIEIGSYRSAIILAWIAVMDRVLEVCEDDSFVRINAARTKWTPPHDREDFSEQHSEFQILDAFREAKFVSRTFARTLQAQLHTRNQSAHPTSTSPSFNVALGYIEDAINSLNSLATVS